MAIEVFGVFATPTLRNQLIANTVLVAMATIMVGLRCVSRRMQHSAIWWDDVCAIACLIHTYGLLALEFVYARIGMDRDVLDIPVQNISLIFKLMVLYEILYYGATLLAKLAYLLLYIRIFVTRAFRIASWVCVGCAICYWLGSMLQVFLLCKPFSFIWDRSIPNGHCASIEVAFTAIGVCNLVTDVMILALPLNFVYRLHMSKAAKLGIYAIFGVGFFVSAISAIRIDVITNINVNNLSESMTWAVFWSVTEPVVAVSNSCLPMLRPILQLMFPRQPRSRQPGSSYPSRHCRAGSGAAGAASNDTGPDEIPLTLVDEEDFVDAAFCRTPSLFLSPSPEPIPAKSIP
ncbi:hypothetical protein ASPZODRAFT_153015 [Penicilliopsis zonata CBS 506.65]|uniref:Rhodopsin domain-containing protein n=1 Tax=Penicilliopsis zonata CBS 506.65 TaxID=1073090 RepID=A0A1L9SDR5_9EURO|nr:hypothetical protein ASPZODRAFT_153015 [Penicilliopsis zonata CBS 506.65]OJJ45319.1 hypothetical protein ASPZODRAFT_153015 [Penicilliopsis zonata CBS 506.65]